MVLIAASIFTKSGKRMIGRCFVDDVTRARLEGLLDAFPKLIGNDKSTQRQHTFIETDSVRYVFHPLDNVYVVLVTTKNSNILEDLETLRLFSRVIPEYCRTIDEKEITNNCFNLIHAFDEIVTLGYRESVNLAQIRTFTEMDSHEERVFMQIKEAQEKAAKDAMAEKAKELKRAQREALTRGLKIGGSGFSSATAISSSSTPLTAVQEPVAAKPAPSRAIGSGKAMKLGTKTRNEDEFLSQLAKEGQAIAPVERTARDSGAGASAVSAPVSNVKREPVHIKCEEKFSASVSRDGALQSGELFGTASLLVSTAEFNTVSIQMSNDAPEGVTIQTHPNLEKKDWLTSSLVKLKSANKPFPVNNDVGVLKWRMTLAGEDQLPLALNCWPQENPDGCQVNIEYTLQREDLALEGVSIIVPLPPSTAPVVSECEGSYEYVRPRNQLVWTLPSIDSSNATGTLEFNVPNGHADHFFPVQVHFHSESLFAKLVVLGAQTMDTASPVVYSTESRLLTDKYEVV